MKQKFEFRNPSMKQYEKQSGGMLPLLVVVVVLVLAGRYLMGADAQPKAALRELKVPHVELTRYLATGSQDMLRLDCQAEADGVHYFCRVEKFRGGDSVAQVVVDQKVAAVAINNFFKRWPAQGAARSTSDGRHSLSWSVSDGEHSVSGAANWRDPAMEQQTTAVLSLEGALKAQLTR